MRYHDIQLTGSLQITGSLTLPAGTTAERPTNPRSGSVRLNTTLGVMEIYTATSGSEWVTVGEQTGPVVGPAQADIEYLLVAGGGGGSQDFAGGGGAGGLLSSSLAAVSSGSSFTVTIGAGGDRAFSSAGYNGDDSTIAGTTITTITAIGGGGGAGSAGGGSAGSGGSGGGAGNGNGSGGSGTIGQGFAGHTAGSSQGAGGGGAGAAATTQNGAPGKQSNITGTPTYYAGGGAGSTSAANQTGGTGGGGDYGTSGTANTGGGGGGYYGAWGLAGDGGSGVAIFAYDSGSINAAGGIVGDAGNGRKYNQFNASNTFKVGSTSDFQIVTSNLVSHFDAGDFASRGTSTWTDLSGNGHNLSGNNITLGSNFYNDFNGSTSYYTKSDTAHNFADNNFTVEIWVKWDSLSSGDNIASKRGTGNPGTRNWLFGYDSTGLVYFLQYHDGVNYTYPQTTSGTVTTGTWYHLVATGDSSNMKVYVNTTEEASASFTSSGIQSTAAPLEIGRRGTNSGYQYLDGQIAQFRAYSSALSAAEVLQNYNATKTNFV